VADAFTGGISGRVNLSRQCNFTGGPIPAATAFDEN
jgi:hypothetical protein